MKNLEAIDIVRNLVESEYTMLDENLRCPLCGNVVTWALPTYTRQQEQHKPDCLIARAKIVLDALEKVTP